MTSDAEHRPAAAMKSWVVNRALLIAASEQTGSTMRQKQPTNCKADTLPSGRSGDPSDQYRLSHDAQSASVSYILFMKEAHN